MKQNESKSPESSKHCCWYCGRETSDPRLVCDLESCRQFDRELMADMKRCERRKFKAGMLAALQQRCKPDEEWPSNRLQRWFYTVKLLLCILFRLSYKGDKTFPDKVTVALFDDDENHWSLWWMSIDVGHGLFTGWWWDYQSH